MRRPGSTRLVAPLLAGARRPGGVRSAVARPPRIVAELGRPETPEETAARKAEASRRHRSNQTVRNLVFALVACLGIVFLLVLVVVRPDQPAEDPVDWSAIADQAQPAVEQPLVDPALPPGWTANAALLDSDAAIPTWYIGFITPAREFIGLRQGLEADRSWLTEQVDGATSDGTVDIDGVDWDVYDRRDSDDPGNLAYSLSATIGDSTVLLFGTAPDEDFRTLASTVASVSPDAPEGG